MKVERIVSSAPGIYPRPHPEKIERENGEISVDAVILDADAQGEEQSRGEKKDPEEGKEQAAEAEVPHLGGPLNVIA